MEKSHHVVELVAVIITLLLIAAGAQALTRKIKLPFTVFLVVIGMVISNLAHNGATLLQPATHYALSSDVILFVFLPTLIFESAFNMDARQLRHNLLPVMVLAVPGLLLSTLIIGLIVAALTPIDMAEAMLLGAILSATDPVAVIALFRQLGAPKRLTILVEGESLFNDATSLVLARIIIGVVAAGYFSFDSAVSGVADFFIVFVGGVLVGWFLGLTIGWLLGLVEADSFIEISLTTILAYVSFLVAEEVFHVSGVMATVAAGLTMGGWGRAKISPSVATYLEHFWEYMASVANALIFLFVGLRVDLDSLLGSLHLLPWVIVAMLVSRAVVIYGLVPVSGYFSKPVDKGYQTVMFWGGLRGAVALAIVLSLKDLPYANTFVALVMGAVLFTLLVQGFTIEGLVRRLGLDKPPLADRVARVEGILAAKHEALERIPDLQSGGLFSARIADTLERQTHGEIDALRRELISLRSTELTEEEERRLLYGRCLAAERRFYYDLFTKGHLSERAYRNLYHSIDVQLDAVRQDLPLPPFTLHPPHGGPVNRFVYPVVDRLFTKTGVPERLRASHIADDYDEAWGRFRSCARVLEDLDTIARERVSRLTVVAEVRDRYHQWFTAARRRIDETAEQFPEFVNAMQERLAGRLLVAAEQDVIEEESRAGVIPAPVAEQVVGELAGAIRQLRGEDLGQLKVAPSELLRKVPFFADIPPLEFERVAATLKPKSLREGEVIIRQGDTGDSLYLIARGVVRVSHSDGETEQDLATLIGGDFVGEMALLHGEPRSATCRAVTPCALYELRREDFDEIRQVCPAIQAALEEADAVRSSALHEATQGT